MQVSTPTCVGTPIEGSIFCAIYNPLFICQTTLIRVKDHYSGMADKFSKTNTDGFKVGGDQQDELFNVLSHPRRRFTLQYLRTVETSLPVSELTTELGAWEDRRTGRSQSRDEQDTIEVSLVHNHLPKMDHAGVVEYDATRQRVTLADGTDEVDAHLQAMTVR